MDIETVDQAPSEERLHRVLWLVKMLRAFVLHVALALLAVIVYFATGTDGLYPIADDMILLSKALARGEHAAPGPVVSDRLRARRLDHLRGDTRAPRLDLQVDRRRTAACAADPGRRLPRALFVHSDRQMAGARVRLRELDFAFAVLASIGILITLIVFPLAIVVALWVVSRTPETSSFVATLDPRLAPIAGTTGTSSSTSRARRSERGQRRRLTHWRSPARCSSSGRSCISSRREHIEQARTALHLVPEPRQDAGLRRPVDRVGPSRLDRVDPGCRGRRRRVAAAIVGEAARRARRHRRSEEAHDPFVLYLRPFDTDNVILPKPLLPLLSSLLSFRPFPCGSRRSCSTLPTATGP
jgi:hypothetical protein